MGFSLQVTFGAMPDTGSVAYCGKGILEHRNGGRHRDLFPFAKGYTAVHKSVSGTTYYSEKSSISCYLMAIPNDQCRYTRVGTLIVATIYLQLIQNRYMFRSFTVL